MNVSFNPDISTKMLNKRLPKEREIGTGPDPYSNEENNDCLIAIEWKSEG